MIAYTASVRQAVQIPSTMKTAKLAFYLDITSLENPSYPGRDKLTLEIRDASTNQLVRLPIDYSSSLQTQTPGAYEVYREIDLSTLQGRKLKIEWKAWTDGHEPTWFRIDDVSLTGTEEMVSTNG